MSLPDLKNRSLLDKFIGFSLTNKLIVVLVTLFIMGAGIMYAPFDWDIPGINRNPVTVDAIPDIGENQQIVFTKWGGRSPQDVEDQVGYPLTVSLLGIPGVKSIRSFSMFGFSSIYIIFKEDIEFYWSRSRILEKLNSLSPGTLPSGVKPMLGPDATALGQVFWYTLEGRDNQNNPTGGWDLEELRSLQDWTVRYSLMSAEGVAEVASIGGFVKEYQIDVNPEAMRAYHVSLTEIYSSLKKSNSDVGARTIEINNVEYVIRGLGFIKNLKDIENVAIKDNNGIPVLIKDLGRVSYGPSPRRGILDKEGSEAVGGVVVTRFGANPLKTIKNVKLKIKDIEPSLPYKKLADGTKTQVKIIPFYDRSGLIHETLNTLNTALVEEILITIIVILLLVNNIRSSLMISLLMPIAILTSFIGMKFFKVDANIVALSGIAIAIGTIVDMGVVLCENTLQHLQKSKPGDNTLTIVFDASSEVGSAILTAVATTVVGFLPVFFMDNAEGKLFKPLAYTKTMVLIASIFLTLFLIPPLSHFLFSKNNIQKFWSTIMYIVILAIGIICGIYFHTILGIFIAGIGVFNFVKTKLPKKFRTKEKLIINGLLIISMVFLLSKQWSPLGPEKGDTRNLIFVGLILFLVMGSLFLLQKFYTQLLKWCLSYKTIFLSLPLMALIFGGVIWSNLGKEFMPDLDEGSFLFMPTTMTHASIGEAHDVLQKQDILIKSIPEISSVVGKLGRVESPLDPAPISMFETIVNYLPEYRLNEKGKRIRFKFREGSFLRDTLGQLIPDKKGKPFRQWRDHIRSSNDIWKEIVKVSKIPGTTSAPKLQPIKARIVMLQSGMRAPMGVKVFGKNLKTIEKVGIELEQWLKKIPSIDPSSVIADRIVGKPYLEINIDRKKISRYGLKIKNVQDVIEVAIGGKPLMTTVEGRERYPVRIRYQRELRSSLEDINKIIIPNKKGVQIPLDQIATIQYTQGPQVIKSENTQLVGYVVFDKKPEFAEVDVVEQAQAFLKEKIDEEELFIPAGTSYKFAGNYENQIRSEKKLMLVLPLALFLIFILLYLQFKNVASTLLVFSGVLVAWSGGFIMIYLYGTPWFLNFSLFGISMRDLFQIHTINLSVAVWVGFLALFGIASDNGVIMCTYLNQTFKKRTIKSVDDIREATIFAARRRIRPSLMTIATTLLALIPILTSSGKGSDVMVPMAIPSFGGMGMVIITVFLVPVLYSGIQEYRFNKNSNQLPNQKGEING